MYGEPPAPPHVLAPGARVVVSGPRRNAHDAAVLAAIAETARRRGFHATTPDDVARAAGTRDFDSFAYARAKAEALADAELVVFAPGWEDDAHAVVTREVAGILGVPTLDWRAPGIAAA